MFIRKYVNDFIYSLVLEKYSKDYLNNLDEDNFALIYNILKGYKFYFIDDIITKYIEIFQMNPDNVIAGIEKLKAKLGEKFVYYIGNDLRYLNTILETDDF